MLFNFISCKRVIGRLIRNTRMTDATFLDDFLEWIPEVIDQLQTHYSLQSCFKLVEVKNHYFKLPCGLVSLEGISYNGSRLRMSNASSSVFLPIIGSFNLGASTFIPDTDETLQNNLNTRISGSDLKMLPQSSSDYYKIHGNAIQTSFDSGIVTIFFLKRHVDEEGYPMIPEVEDFQQAVYWYLLRQMIGAGFEHPLFDYNFCDTKFDLHAGRALAFIKYPTVDEMESTHRATTRLIPPQNFYDTFFSGGEQYKGINGL